MVRSSKGSDAAYSADLHRRYSGANIPGKRVEPLNYAGGMVDYVDSLHKSLENNYQGWHVEKDAAKA